MQQLRYVVGVVEDGFTIVGPTGSENGMRDGLSVEHRFRLTEAGKEERCAHDRLADWKRIAKDGLWRRKGDAHVVIASSLWLARAVWIGGDPVRVPVGRLQETGEEGR